MKEATKSKLIFGIVIAIMFVLGLIMFFIVCEYVKAEEIETLINKYPVWVFTVQGDSTFQTVQILKCRQIYPNGQVKLLGYRVAVDSSGCRIYEEESVWFLNWAVWGALGLQVKLGKKYIPAQRGKGD